MRIQMNHGFTLTELAVTLSVIAVLAIIFLPLLLPRGADYENSSRTVCISNQRQLAISILSYAQDNDEVLPMPNKWVAATGLSADLSIWYCLNATSKGSSAAPNYGYNGHLYDLVTEGNKRDVTSITLGEIPNPEQIECTMDMKVNYLAPVKNPNPAKVLESGKPVVYSFATGAKFCHYGSIVISYLDGHVATLKQSQTGKGTTAYNVPANDFQPKEGM